MTEASSRRWPYTFDLDDVEIVGAVDNGTVFETTNANVPGVKLTHGPTGIVAVADALATREENLRVALQRLDLRIRRAGAKG